MHVQVLEDEKCYKIDFPALNDYFYYTEDMIVKKC